MASMNVREMHKRLMLYKMVQAVMKKSKKIDNWEESCSSPWLCNVYSSQNVVNLDRRR
jgi:hypothetical protein